MSEASNRKRKRFSQRLAKRGMKYDDSKDDTQEIGGPSWPPMDYQPLLDRHIRLINIQGTRLVSDPSWPADNLAICVSVKTVELKDVMQNESSYEAVSYVWGSTLLKRPVLIDGMLLMVTSNLYNFLWTLLYHSDALVRKPNLWIDAVCINQSNNREKSHQVSMMREIYSCAERVVVWLGMGGETSISGLDSAWNLLQRDDDTDLSDLLMRQGMAAFIKECAWFHRAWTFQEILLAKEAEVRYSTVCISWNRFSSAVRRVEDENRDVDGDLRLFSSAFQIDNPCTSLLRLLSASHGRQATEPRDRVFSLLGLYKGQFLIHPDYERSLKWVWSQAGIAIITETRHLGILDLGHVKPKSWLPDLQDSNFRRMEDWFKEGPINNLTKFDPSFVPDARIDSTDSSLFANGAVLGWLREDSISSNEELILFYIRASHLHNHPGTLSKLPDCLYRSTPETMKNVLKADGNETNQPSRHYHDRCDWQELHQIHQSLQDHLLGTCTCQSRDHENRNRKKDWFESYMASGVSPDVHTNSTREPVSILLACVLFSSTRILLVKPETRSDAPHIVDRDDDSCKPQLQVSVVTDVWDPFRMIDSLTRHEVWHLPYLRTGGGFAHFKQNGHRETWIDRAMFMDKGSEFKDLEGVSRKLRDWRSPCDLFRAIGIDMSWTPTRFHLTPDPQWDERIADKGEEQSPSSIRHCRQQLDQLQQQDGFSGEVDHRLCLEYPRLRIRGDSPFPYLEELES